MNNLAQTINNMNQAMNGKADNSVTEKILSDTSSLLSKAKEALENLKKKLKEVEAEKDGTKKAILYRKEIIPIMEDLRRPIDELELLVDSSLWPVPYYRDLMFK
jgi:glutamine synthetase